MSQPLVGQHLEALYARLDAPERLAADPLAFAHRYTDPADQELAALIAVSFAHGKVDLFFPVLRRLFAWLDDGGGPVARLRTWAPTDPLPDGLGYRWHRPRDTRLWLATLASVYTPLPRGDGAPAWPAPGRLEPLFAGPSDARGALVQGVDALRARALSIAPRIGLEAAAFAELPRGFRYFVPSPEGGSGCKRWCLYLRWMVRPPVEGVDLGLWRCLTPADLIMPIDVHVGRVSRFLGLLDRTDGSWRNAVALTEALKAFDAHDPTRFDFAIAHLGISQRCRGRFDAEVCPTCPLVAVCVEARQGP